MARDPGGVFEDGAQIHPRTNRDRPARGKEMGVARWQGTADRTVARLDVRDVLDQSYSKFS
jgi:hypothetical protein